MEAIANVTGAFFSGANGLGMSVLERQGLMLTGHSPGVSAGGGRAAPKSPRAAGGSR